MKRVVLAYSGGLDTSVCIPLLREQYGYDEVIAVTVNVGQPEYDLIEAAERARKLSDAFWLLDAQEEFARDYLVPLIKANGNYEGYVLGTAIARPLIAKKVVEVAQAENAQAVAHGCTGKGNDQLRFDAVFMASGLTVIAPIRELSLTREEEKRYAAAHGVSFETEKRWSVDENLWSRSIEGSELEDPAAHPREEIYQWTVAQDKAPDEAAQLSIEFERGVPVAVNGRQAGPVALIRELNELGGKHGVGRTDMIEDRVLGFKARENYEHPAATILLEAHRDLEQLVLTRNELRFKAQVDRTWSELVYQGLLMDPLYDALNAFIDKTQERMTGTVHLRLNKGVARVVGRESPHALYTSEVSFDAKQEQRIVEGFSIYHCFQARMARRSGE
jgi:argininosuccinate synthase